MNYIYIQYVSRQYLRLNKQTMEIDVVSVANTNMLPVAKHMELLNLNSPDHVYLAYLGNIEFKD